MLEQGPQSGSRPSSPIVMADKGNGSAKEVVLFAAESSGSTLRIGFVVEPKSRLVSPCWDGDQIGTEIKVSALRAGYCGRGIAGGGIAGGGIRGASA